MAWRSDASARGDLDDCLGEDAKVQRQTAAVDVRDIESKLVFPRESVAAVDLCQPGDSRQHVVASRLFGCVTLEVLHEQRPWPDQSHLTRQDVQQLRQFVDAGAAEETT